MNGIRALLACVAQSLPKHVFSCSYKGFWTTKHSYDITQLMKKLKEKYTDKPGLELAEACARAALDAKAENLVVLDVRGLATFTDYFVIMDGRSTRHVQGIADAVNDEMSKKRVKASQTEGLQDGMWVLLDYEDVVVHIFYYDQRDFYNLEGLWYDAKKVEIKNTPEE